MRFICKPSNPDYETGAVVSLAARSVLIAKATINVTAQAPALRSRKDGASACTAIGEKSAQAPALRLGKSRRKRLHCDWGKVGASAYTTSWKRWRTAYGGITVKFFGSVVDMAEMRADASLQITPQEL